MGKGHHGGHHHHRRGGGRRIGGGYSVDVVAVPEVVELDCYWERLPDGRMVRRCAGDEARGPGASYLRYSDSMGLDAGDLFPTSPQLIRSAVIAEDGNWNALYAAMITALASSKVNSAYTNSFTEKRAGWQFFRDSMLNDTPVFSGDAAVQLDQWKTERSTWAKDLESKAGVALPVLNQSPPPMEKPVTTAGILSGATGLILAGAALAGVLIFGRMQK